MNNFIRLTLLGIATVSALAMASSLRYAAPYGPVSIDIAIAAVVALVLIGGLNSKRS